MSTAIMPPMTMPSRMRAFGSMFLSVSTIQVFSAPTGGAMMNMLTKPMIRMPKNG